MQCIRFFILGLLAVGGSLFILPESEAAMSAKTEESIQQLVEGNSAFALALYGQLKDGEGNLFFSPYGISSALAMTYGGARGDTAGEIAEALHFSQDREALRQAFAELSSQVNAIQEAGNIVLTVANALWLQEGFDLREEFLALTNTQYGAGVFQVDFEKAFEKARIRINEWVEQQTQGKIQELLASGSVGELTRLVLTNAMYFKGRWEQEFQKEQTQDDSFYVSQDEDVKVPLMQQQSNFKYGETEHVQLVQLPYEGGELAMLIALPKAKDGLAELETALTVETLESWLPELAMREVKVVLPRFRTETRFELSESLKALGMSRAFTETADFSGIDGTKQLSISSILHKAFVEVTEEGTEAAASTAVIIGVTSIQDPVPIPEFRADHPFLYAIRDLESGSILFLGRCVNPAQ